MVSRSTKIGQLGRRGFIKALTTLGVSGPAAKALDDTELQRLTENPEEDVPFIKAYKHTNQEEIMSGDASIQREPVYDTMPRPQWVRINATENAADQLRQELRQKLRSGKYNIDEEVVSQLKVSITNQENNNKLELVVKSVERLDSNGNTVLQGPDIAKVREVSPSVTQGEVSYDGKKRKLKSIPVKVKSVQHKNQYFDASYRPVPAGCDIYGTVGSPAQNDSGTNVWLTAAHVLGREDEHPVYQPRDGNKIGESDQVKSKGDGDVATIAPGPASVAWQIAASVSSPDTYEWPVEGMITDYTIKQKLDNGDSVYFQGKKTGRDDNAVVTSYSSDPDGSGNEVQISHDSDDGDSGCPYFDIINGGAYIMAIHSAEGDYDYWAKGTTIEWTEDELKVTV